MMSSNRSTLSIVPALLALAVLILVGFLLFSDLKISRTEQTLNPPIEIIDPQLPLTVIELEEEIPSSEQIIEKEASIFIDLLSPEQDEAITINENQDQFVRHDSIITLPTTESGHNNQDLSINQIIASEEISDNALFYLHRVTEQDQQGLWGIIQSGLINKFREGVKIEGIASNKDSIQTIIPADADEKLRTGLSSFLGKILNDKVNSSYIYNFNTNTMSHDPNQVYPGQELVLIHFSAQELSQIYQFFSDKRNQGIETFAIGD